MIVAGFGFRSSAKVAACEAALALAQPGHPPVTALAAPHDKADLLAPLAHRLGIPLIALAADRLTGVATPTRSRASLHARGTGSVAEAAALVAAGAGARLLTRRCISPDRTATCAIAQGLSI
ncbi:cobalamin biosynthesis protein [Sphingomonas sp. 37zxx]|uniref:cobalamin biosynthesis protein n=1 Tax=Sphingomonas sp. 37zxx TaxID=1550073 RepID=UPI00053C0776|nr:cobalamin biosynthesis protein [Sphingomonas sp. 37zxx]